MRLGVRVVLVVVPALRLERWENNRRFNDRMIACLRDVQRRHPNVVAVLDYNNFDHPWRSASDYTDLEHMAPATVRRFSRLFAHWKNVLASEAAHGI